MDAFDADVLIYASIPGHPLGRRVRTIFAAAETGDGNENDAAEFVGVGSVLLLPELLSKPLRDDAHEDLDALSILLGRLDLRPVDPALAKLATALGATYRLRAADAVHLATAVATGADRFITNNRKDFPRSIDEVDVTYPTDLPDPPAG